MRKAWRAVRGASREVCVTVGREVERIQQLVLDMQHRRVVGQKVFEQCHWVMPERPGDNAQVRDAEKVLLEALAMGGAVAASAARRRSDDDRARDGAVVHHAVLGYMV